MPFILVGFKHGGDLFTQNLIYLSEPFGNILMNGGF